MTEETNHVDMADADEQYVVEKKVFGLSYVLDPVDFQPLFDTYLGLMDKSVSDRHDWRTMRQPSVFIHFNNAPHILNKVGGIGKQVEFEITHLGVSDKVLALRLVPIASYHQVMDGEGDTVLQTDSRLRYWSKNEIPVLVVATRDGGKPIDANYLERWTPITSSVENRRFIARVSAKQEISIELVSKKEEKAKQEAEYIGHSTAPRKRHSDPFTNFRTGHGHKTQPDNRESRSVYGGDGARKGGTRNAFGYSLG
jgi:hypothetical protein